MEAILIKPTALDLIIYANAVHKRDNWYDYMYVAIIDCETKTHVADIYVEYEGYKIDILDKDFFINKG